MPRPALLAVALVLALAEGAVGEDHEPRSAASRIEHRVVLQADATTEIAAACVRQEGPSTCLVIHRRTGTAIERLAASRYFYLHPFPGGVAAARSFSTLGESTGWP